MGLEENTSIFMANIASFVTIDYIGAEQMKTNHPMT